MSPTILLMAKAPRPGWVKTRLAEDIGPAEATRVYRELVERQLRELPARWRVQIHYAPANAEPEMRAWLGEAYDFAPQVAGDLGARLIAASEQAFSRGAPAVIAIGGDCPELNRKDFFRAAEILESRDVVLGPARDGGYYLIGLRRPAPFLFTGIPWSTPRVLSATRHRLRHAELSYGTLDLKEDVDDVTSLRRVLDRTIRRGAPRAGRNNTGIAWHL